MIFAINIGNTHFNLSWKINNQNKKKLFRTDSFKSKQEIIIAFKEVMITEYISYEDIIGVVISSVVPNITGIASEAVFELFHVTPFIINKNIKMDINISSYKNENLGNDRIVICESALFKYQLPVIIFDFGTATTINIINEFGHFIGGSILTGLTMGLQALSAQTALLPQGELSESLILIGSTTDQCLLSGAIYGNATMLDGMTKRIESFLKRKATVIITGGSAKYIAQVCDTEVIHDTNLLIDGLYILFNKNITQER
jgi:type III pantothenate kinase